MNKNIDLTKNLKDCLKRTKFYTLVCGEAVFNKINKDYLYTIRIDTDAYSD